MRNLIITICLLSVSNTAWANETLIQKRDGKWELYYLPAFGIDHGRGITSWSVGKEKITIRPDKAIDTEGCSADLTGEGQEFKIRAKEDCTSDAFSVTFERRNLETLKWVSVSPNDIPDGSDLRLRYSEPSEGGTVESTPKQETTPQKPKVEREKNPYRSSRLNKNNDW